MYVFTKEDKKKLVKALKNDYNKEELKNFIARAIGERATLILSTDYKSNDVINKQRKSMIKTLEQLQDVATDVLNKKLKKVV